MKDKMILLIDDEPQYVSNYEHALKAMGFEVEYIEDVNEALEFIETRLEEVSAIILDIMMPVGEGYSSEETESGTRMGVSIYNRIRQKMSDLPIFFLTNVTDKAVREKLLVDKNNYFFSKGRPFDFARKFELILKGGPK